MYRAITIFDESRIVEMRNDTYFKISETKCIGIMGIPVAYHMRYFDNHTVAFIEGIPVSRPSENGNNKESMGILITDPFFKRITHEKISQKENPDKIVFVPMLYEAR